MQKNLSETMGGTGSGRTRSVIPGTLGAELLIAKMKREELTLEAMSERLEIQPAALHRLLKNPIPNPTLGTLRKIRDVLGISADAWLDPPRASTRR